ncbi:hypothetical protein OKW52_09045 [Pararhodobacter zhoushanensis]|uniref:Response regulatory domain-containing protein n=1 Tax=Pararhodobacter zhoushanensis TaxID=2479545 RepID=A0ABT3GXW4_9RHOB|nr:hypothetical protein [Pararhodobacter zhoushanensis]MCW1932399.1 hypothetical protein [Pararhodobacter zhoushanensis]
MTSLPPGHPLHVQAASVGVLPKPFDPGDLESFLRRVTDPAVSGP